MQMKCDMKSSRDGLLSQLQEKRSAKTADSSTRDSDNGTMRGEPMLELVR